MCQFHRVTMQWMAICFLLLVGSNDAASTIQDNANGATASTSLRSVRVCLKHKWMMMIDHADIMRLVVHQFLVLFGFVRATCRFAILA